MSDLRIRELERRAASGDQDAQIALAIATARTRPVKRRLSQERFINTFEGSVEIPVTFPRLLTGLFATHASLRAGVVRVEIWVDGTSRYALSAQGNRGGRIDLDLEVYSGSVVSIRCFPDRGVVGNLEFRTCDYDGLRADQIRTGAQPVARRIRGFL